MRWLPFVLLLGCSSSDPTPDAPTDTGASDSVVDTGSEAATDTAPKCDPERTEADRPDDATGYMVRAFYVLPSDGKDERHDVEGRIAKSIEIWNDWLAGQTGGKRLRLDTCDGKLDIGFKRLSKTDAQIKASGPYVREAIEKELAPRGKKIVAAYYGGGSTYSCGGGAWPPELVGHVGALYLHGTPEGPYPCDVHTLARVDDGYFEFAMLHEIFHTLGAAATCAPHQLERGHVSEDPRDLMYRGPEFWKPSILDLNRDDYYGHSNAGCLDVAKSVFFDPLPDGAVLPPGW